MCKLGNNLLPSRVPPVSQPVLISVPNEETSLCMDAIFLYWVNRNSYFATLFPLPLLSLSPHSLPLLKNTSDMWSSANPIVWLCLTPIPNLSPFITCFINFLKRIILCQPGFLPLSLGWLSCVFLVSFLQSIFNMGARIIKLITFSLCSNSLVFLFSITIKVCD